MLIILNFEELNCSLAQEGSHLYKEMFRARVICQSWFGYERDVDSVRGTCLNKPPGHVLTMGCLAVEW
jgi:hypothetical protein